LSSALWARHASGTRTYDIKTHEPEYVRAHPDAYAAQLDVYATIYEELKARRIDGTGVIATSIPLKLRGAISRSDPAATDREFQAWEPLIGLPYTRESRDRYSCPSYQSWRLEGRKLRKDNVFDYFRIAENREEDEQFRYAAEEEGSDDISD
jgi:hypothetical protein